MFFQSDDVRIVELGKRVVYNATRLRAQYDIATPDALQAASALTIASYPLFVTADKGFQALPELDIILL